MPGCHPDLSPLARLIKRRVLLLNSSLLAVWRPRRLRRGERPGLPRDKAPRAVPTVDGDDCQSSVRWGHLPHSVPYSQMRDVFTKPSNIRNSAFAGSPCA